MSELLSAAPSAAAAPPRGGSAAARPVPRFCLALLAAAACLGAAGATARADWPQFRGPDGQGHGPATPTPLAWSETENVMWKTHVPGRGWSSPVVERGQIWLTTADEVQHTLEAVTLELDTGRLARRIEIFRAADLERVAPKNSHASPTPVIDGDLVFVHFGAHGTACLAADGRVLWKTQLLYNHHHGPAASPVIWKDVLIIVCDGLDQQFIVGLEKTTGRVLWQTKRDGDHAYCTPLVIRTPAGDQVISPGGKRVTAYDPATGQELWHLDYDGHSVVPRPVIGNELLYVSSGYWTPVLYAIRPDGRGDVTSSHVAWTLRRGVPHNPSPLLVGSQLYLISDRGVLTCLNAQDGSEIWRQRLEGNFSASPTLAGGQIYVQNEEGTTYVLAPGSEFRILATNRIEGQTLASLAFTAGRILLRSDAALYCIGGPGSIASPAAAQRPLQVPRTFR